VDLIYLDPPFNSKANYNILYKEPTGEQSQAQITAFEDTWHWTEESERTFQEIIDTAPAMLVDMMVASRKFVGINDVMAYLTMMAIRLLELHRVLKSSGSIYLHCDPTASHYLKILMDTIFGKKNFRNEIAWCYRKWTNAAQHLQRNHDIILVYNKKFGGHVFNRLYDENTPQQKKYDRGWDVNKVSGNIRQLLVYDKAKAQDKIDSGQYDRIIYREDKKKVALQDWWEIPILNSQAKERLGYPTQKPTELLRKIIEVSSNKGDIVLDPFCGCGTTITASQALNRNWIGIDITHLAINLIKHRLKDMYGLQPKKDYEVIGEPEDLAGATELASQNRYQFQWWALSLINARPYQDKKKGSDTGIDGYIYFQEEKDKVQKVIVQVKSGHVSVKDIRDLGHVIDRENAEIGVFITLENPTKPMITEAVQKGFYKSTTGKQYPKLQIKTIEDLLQDNKLDLPSTHIAHKKAQPSDKSEQTKLNI